MIEKPVYNSEEEINLRLRTLTLIRWIAVFGQLGAIVVSFYYLDFIFNIYQAFFLILCSAVLNIIIMIRYPLTKILNFTETFYFLFYDLIQLVLLLSLTGGLTNPFCVLILAPIVIAATYLDLKRTILIVSISAISLTILTFFYFPLESDQLGINKNDFSRFGIFSIWAALLIALVFISAYCFKVADESRKNTRALRETQLALSNEEKVSALMSLTAAAVHELGTPLSTISVIAKELMNNTNKEDLNHNDLVLINSQIKRCSNILERLRTDSFSEKSNEFINKLDFKRMINEIIDSYQNEKIEFIVQTEEYFDTNNITILRSPEIIHSISNIVDNAIKHAKKRVIVNLKDSVNDILIEIIDDGEGFSQDIYPLLGEPYIRKSTKNKHKGLGLGLFISKNLLGKNFGDIKFLNLKDQGGCVQILLSKKSLGL